MTMLLLLLACNDARIDELDREIERLGKDIDTTTALVARMERGVARARRHVAPTPRIPPQYPADFNPDTPLPPGDTDRPDILLLSIDTLRADHLGAYGYERDTSPFIDELASDGTLFAQHWSPSPWTLPSHATMLTGLLPNVHGAIEDHTRIRTEVPMIQEAMAGAGYLTAGAVATMFVSSKFGFDRGFGEVDVSFFDFGVYDKATNNQSTVDAGHVFDSAFHWAQQQPEGIPIFTFLHVYDVHFGYNAPPPWNQKYDRESRLGDAIYRSYYDYKKRMITEEQLAHQVAQYDEEIAYVDHAFRNLVTRWRASGRDLIVLVTADHGEEFGERGSWGHAHTLFDEQLHVPLIVNGPGIKRQTIASRSGGEDIAPTIAGLAGVEFPTVDGVDRARQIRVGSPIHEPATPARYAETSRFQTLQYRWHEPPFDLIVDMVRANRRLCNLERDPNCKENVFKANRTRATSMFQDLIRYVGEPWIVEADGTLVLEKGTYAYRGIERGKGKVPVTQGQRFALFPQDGIVRIHAGEDDLGPFGALGKFCALPDGAALTYDGIFDCGDGGVELSYDECLELAALGYMGDCESLSDAPAPSP